MLISKSSPSFLRKEIQRFSRLPKQFYRHCLGNSPALSLFILLIFIFAVCLALPVDADMVYGRIYGADVRPGDVLFLSKDGREPKIRATVDANRGYSITIPTGLYKVEFNNMEAWIQSFPQPARQDIYLKNR
jgi:hypothetical protein